MIDMHAWYEYEAGIPANLPHPLDAIDVQPCRQTPDSPRRPDEDSECASKKHHANYSHLSRKALSRMALDAFCKLIRLTRS